MIYCKSNYSKKRALLRILQIVLYCFCVALFAYTLSGARTAYEQTYEIAQLRADHERDAYYIQKLERDLRLLETDVAMLYNIQSIGDYVSPKE